MTQVVDPAAAATVAAGQILAEPVVEAVDRPRPRSRLAEDQYLRLWQDEVNSLRQAHPELVMSRKG